MAEAVPVKHVAFEKIGEGHEAPVGMVGKSPKIIVGVLAAEEIEHEEGIKTFLQRAVEQAHETHARTVLGGATPVKGFDGSAPSKIRGFGHETYLPGRDEACVCFGGWWAVQDSNLRPMD